MKERILKRKLYLVLSILTIVTILSSAAICNLGKNLTEGVLGDIAEDINQGIGSSDDSEKDSTNKGNSSDSNSSIATVQIATVLIAIVLIAIVQIATVLIAIVLIAIVLIAIVPATRIARIRKALPIRRTAPRL